MLRGDIWPDPSIFSINREPFFHSGLGVRLDRVDRAFRLANTTIDAFVWMDDEHILAFVEAVHRAHLDTIHVLAANAALVDDVGQLSLLPRERSSALRELGFL